MTPPLIGITTYGRDENNKFYLRAEYVDSVRRACGLPVLLPPGDAHIQHLLRHLDGVILAGGGDLDPDLYGGTRHDSIYMVDPERDKTEMGLVRFAVDSAMPTLGICRGTQVINVALGGTLIEHLPDVVGQKVLHRLPAREPTQHKITLTAGSHLAEVLGEPEFIAASWHHQAIRATDGLLSVVAHAPDGTVEAVEMPDHPWLIGVQWHPELTAACDPVQQRLFDAFVKASGEMRGKRG